MFVSTNLVLNLTLYSLVVILFLIQSLVILDEQKVSKRHCDTRGTKGEVEQGQGEHQKD